jgi:hypothetical protein
VKKENKVKRYFKIEKLALKACIEDLPNLFGKAYRMINKLNVSDKDVYEKFEDEPYVDREFKFLAVACANNAQKVIRAMVESFDFDISMRDNAAMKSAAHRGPEFISLMELIEELGGSFETKEDPGMLWFAEKSEDTKVIEFVKSKLGV